MSPKSSVKLTCPINEPACLETRNWGSSILPAGLLDFEGVGDTRMLTQCANTSRGDSTFSLLCLSRKVGFGFSMEPSGFEPLTPCMPCKKRHPPRPLIATGKTIAVQSI